MILGKIMQRGWALTVIVSVALYVVVLNQWYLVAAFPFDVSVQSAKKTSLIAGRLSICFLRDASPSIVDNSVRIPVRFDVENLYDLKQALATVRLCVRNLSEPERMEDVLVLPAYREHMNSHEINCIADGAVSLPLREGTYEVIALCGEERKVVDTVDMKLNGIGRLFQNVPERLWGVSTSLDQLTVLVSLTTLVTSLWLDRRRYARTPEAGNLVEDLGWRAAVVFLTSACAVAFPALNRIIPFAFLYLAALPAYCFVNPLQRACRKALPVDFFKGADDSEDGVPPLLARAAPSVILLSTLAMFAYVLFHNNSFHWAIYEERDFIRACHVVQTGVLPCLGPELLQGGQTPGGLLYCLLAPLTLLRNYPDVFSWFNKILFFSASGILYLLLSRFMAKPAALLGTILFCTSQVVYAFAFWPIHPSMSVFFFVCFAYCVLRGFAEKNDWWLLLSAACLAMLVQLHFSYYLTLIPFGALLWYHQRHQRSCLDSDNAAERGGSSKWIIAGVVAVFLIFSMPYLIGEAVGDFANLRAMLGRDRATPSYAPVTFLWGGRITPVSAMWLWGTWGVGNEVISTVVAVAFMAGLVGLVAAANRKDEVASRRFATAVLVLATTPFLLLALSGAGHHCRHTLPFAAILFVICAYGFDQVCRWRPKSGAIVLTVLATGLLVSWGTALAKEKALRPLWMQAATEWAGEFETRSKVSEYLIKDLHLSPSDYERHAFWWFFAHAMHPDIYQLEWQRAAQAHGTGSESTRPAWLGEHDLLVLYDTGYDLPPFLTRRYTTSSITDRAGNRTVYLARPRKTWGMVSPAGNSRDAIELSTRQREILNLRLNQGLFKVDPTESFAGEENYLLSLGKDGRIRMLLSVRERPEGSGFRYDWKIDSPSMINYFSEIKTIWKPYFLAANASTGESKQIPIVDDVLGNILFKPPMSGSFYLDGRTPWKLSLGIRGYFDQSCMQEPLIEEQCWVLDEAGRAIAMRNNRQAAKKRVGE